MPITTRGTWPGLLTLRRGWAKATARPWNDDVDAVQLRLVRGSKEFVAACCEELALSHSEIVSPPLPEPSEKMWRDIGFKPWLSLDLYTRDLNIRIEEPATNIEIGSVRHWGQAVAIDSRAFAGYWRLGAVGLAEAKDATAMSTLLVVGEPLVAFAIVGRSGSISYLQRVAVEPDQQGNGLGRSLVRAAMRWGKLHGASQMMLNTQPGNTAAAALYVSEGFTQLPAGLSVLKYEPL